MAASIAVMLPARTIAVEAMVHTRSIPTVVFLPAGILIGRMVATFRIGTTTLGGLFTESERRYIDRAADQARSEHDEYVVEARKRVRSKARRIWSGAEPATVEHSYCVRKQVEPEGLRTRYGCLLVPML